MLYTSSFAVPRLKLQLKVQLNVRLNVAVLLVLVAFHGSSYLRPSTTPPSLVSRLQHQLDEPIQQQSMAFSQRSSDVGALWEKALDDYQKTAEVDMRQRLRTQRNISSIMVRDERSSHCTDQSEK
jgi:hypothetical protein